VFVALNLNRVDDLGIPAFYVKYVKKARLAKGGPRS